jgi:peptidoglycan pentaglycine glycine transferase (the first glycine)
MITVLACKQQTVWDTEILAFGGHPLQLWGWGEVKAAHGWAVERVLVYNGGAVIGAAQLLIKRLPMPLKALVYIPRGPIARGPDRVVVLDTLAGYVKKQYSAVVLTIEPDWQTVGLFPGWKRSANTILIPRTLILDLSKSEEDLLADMTKKTRQYIRKSSSEGVEIKKVTSRAELASCLTIYRHTAERAKFALHSDQYYYDIFDKLGEHSLVMMALHDGKPVAFLWLVISKSTAFELYGGMNDDGQHLRANYALKWQTIQRTKQWGIERYDFNGLLNDGVSTFKQSFAAHENTLIGTYDKPLSPLYYVWQHGLPYAKKVVRILKKR